MNSDLHPFVESGLVRTGESTSFHPLICCDHSWAHGQSHRTFTDRKDYDDSCTRCGASAVRDGRNGSIVEFDAKVEYEELHDLGNDRRDVAPGGPIVRRRRAA